MVIGLGLWLLFGAYTAWDTRRQRKKVPLEQRVEELRQELRTGVPNVRGHIRINPSNYPGISTNQAEDMARAEGFLRQAHGAKGQWLFYRTGTRPGSSAEVDMRGGPALDVLRESAAAQRTARWIHERDGFDPLDEATLIAAEKGLRKSRAKSDRVIVGGFLCMLAGLTAEGFARIVWGFWLPYAVLQVCAVTLLVLAVLLMMRAPRVRKEGNRLHGPVIAAYREVVISRENERNSPRQPHP
ncbi:hypothetical protein ACFY12_04245 [Streptomyces sp. NPDC001339]|uniref:hypothetical protein n=1 Tax=Streptomyces sp. NPDC001339 TaxID=3364563 RepID=UPI0036B2C1DC